MKETSQWLAEEWANRLGPAISAMTGQAAQAVCAPGEQPVERQAEDFAWRQGFDAAPGAALWVVFPRPVWHDIGTQVLRSAGLYEEGAEIDSSEVQGTFQEVLSQSLSPLAAVLGARFGREVALDRGELIEPPDGLEWSGLAVTCQSKELGTVWLAAGPELHSALLAAPKASQTPEPPESAGLSAPAEAAVSQRPSRTLDLLLEVELPVGVSFGRAQMRLKDAIKLTTGSIVELNRSISEPVEIIVNNCVIARGEVVVVEGNYGVRICQIISREERLRTLF